LIWITAICSPGVAQFNVNKKPKGAATPMGSNMAT